MCHPDHPLQSQGAPSPTLSILVAEGSELCPCLRTALGGRIFPPSRLRSLAGSTLHPLSGHSGVQRPGPLNLAWDNFQGPSWSQSSPYWSLGVTAPEFNFPLQNHASITPWYVFCLWGCANKSPVCKSQCLHSGNLTEDSLHIYFPVGQFEWFKLITAYHLRFSIYLVWNEGEIHQVKGKIRNSIFSQGRWPNSEKEKCTICNNYKRRNTGGCPLFFWASDVYRNLKGKD